MHYFNDGAEALTFAQARADEFQRVYGVKGGRHYATGARQWQVSGLPLSQKPDGRIVDQRTGDEYNYLPVWPGGIDPRD